MSIETETVRIRAADGHELEAFLAHPAGAPKGAIVLGQEMYGVNEYLRETCRFFASHGYTTIAPSLYDRVESGLVFPYDKESHDRAQKIYKAWNYCWGGTLAWIAACRRAYAVAVAYYGSMMPDFANETSKCPVIAHVGEIDNTMPPARLDLFRAAQPDVPMYVWEGARHGFDNPGRVDRYHAHASAKAREVTLKLLAQTL